jgi:hypothetical protein
VLDHKADTAFRISCERPDIRLNKLDQVSHQLISLHSSHRPAPCDAQRQFCPSFDYSSHLYTFRINSVVESDRRSALTASRWPVRLMALSANRRSSLFLQRCAMQSFKARSHSQRMHLSSSHCSIIFVNAIWPPADGRLARTCPLRITQRVLCGS